MSISQSQISSLYISLFGRVSEGSGSKYWLNLANSKNLNVSDIANAMLKTDAAKEFFSGNIDSSEAFISHIYKNTLNKDANMDKEGKAFWIDKLNNGMDRSIIISELLKQLITYLQIR